MYIEINRSRIGSIASVLSKMGYDGFIRLDTNEPEYVILSKIYEKTNDVRIPLVVGIAAALIDYKLIGDAYLFWNTLLNIFDHRIMGKQIDLSELYSLMMEFVETPPCGYYRETKKKRLEKFFRRYAETLWRIDYKNYSSNPSIIWKKLAYAMGQDVYAKTIVFAAKIIDLVSLITTGQYADFSDVRYIPVDFHIARMSLYSGVIHLESYPYARYRSNILNFLVSDDVAKRTISEAWYTVAKELSGLLGFTVTTFRIDSLLWQLSKTIKRNMNRSEAVMAITKYLTRYAGLDHNSAIDIAEELLYNYGL